MEATTVQSWVGKEAADFWVRRQLCPVCHVGPNQPCKGTGGYHDDRKQDAIWAANRLIKSIKDL